MWWKGIGRPLVGLVAFGDTLYLLASAGATVQASICFMFSLYSFWGSCLEVRVPRKALQVLAAQLGINPAAPCWFQLPSVHTDKGPEGLLGLGPVDGGPEGTRASGAEKRAGSGRWGSRVTG